MPLNWQWMPQDECHIPEQSRNIPPQEMTVNVPKWQWINAPKLTMSALKLTINASNLSRTALYLYSPGTFPQKHRALCWAEKCFASHVAGEHWRDKKTEIRNTESFKTWQTIGCFAMSKRMIGIVFHNESLQSDITSFLKIFIPNLPCQIRIKIKFFFLVYILPPCQIGPARLAPNPKPVSDYQPWKTVSLTLSANRQIFKANDPKPV